MKKMQFLWVLVPVFLVAMYFYFVVVVPPHSVVKVSGWNNSFFVETKSQHAVLFRFHTGVVKYETYELFEMNDLYSVAPQFPTQVLKTDCKFTVLFPCNELSVSDTLSLFARIRAHAFVAMQDASRQINGRFYGNEKETFNTPFPAIFAECLNQTEESGLGELYFVNVDVTRILFGTLEDKEVVNNSLLATKSFLMRSKTLSDHHGAICDLDSLVMQFNLNFKQNGGVKVEI